MCDRGSKREASTHTGSRRAEGHATRCPKRGAPGRRDSTWASRRSTSRAPPLESRKDSQPTCMCAAGVSSCRKEASSALSRSTRSFSRRRGSRHWPAGPKRRRADSPIGRGANGRPRILRPGRPFSVPAPGAGPEPRRGRRPGGTRGGAPSRPDRGRSAPHAAATGRTWRSDVGGGARAARGFDRAPARRHPFPFHPLGPSGSAADDALECGKGVSEPRGMDRRVGGRRAAGGRRPAHAGAERERAVNGAPLPSVGGADRIVGAPLPGEGPPGQSSRGNNRPLVQVYGRPDTGDRPKGGSCTQRFGRMR
jgi:hypothetical protein